MTAVMPRIAPRKRRPTGEHLPVRDHGEPTDLRSHVRFKIPCRVRYDLGGGSAGICATADISAGGAFLQDVFLALDARVDLILQLAPTPRPGEARAPEELIKLGARVLRVTPAGVAVVFLPHQRAELGQLRQALERAARRQLERTPQHCQADWVRLGRFLEECGRPGDALSVYIRTLEQDRTDLGLHEYVAEQLLDAGTRLGSPRLLEAARVLVQRGLRIEASATLLHLQGQLAGHAGQASGGQLASR